MDDSSIHLHIDYIKWLEAVKTTVESGGTVYAESILGGQPLTRVSDTNVTLTLTGTPDSALLKPVGLTVGWSGTLAATRLNANVVQAVTNDTNVTGSIAAQVLTLGWTGTLALARGGTAANLSATGGSNQVLKQASVGAAITVGTLAVANLSDGSNVALLNAANTFTAAPQTISSATPTLTLTRTGLAKTWDVQISGGGNFLFVETGVATQLSLVAGGGVLVNSAASIAASATSFNGTLAFGGGSAISSSTKLATFVALANAAGVLTNDGAGVLSWATAGTGTITGSGTTGLIPQWSSASALTDTTDFYSSGSGVGTLNFLRSTNATATGYLNDVGYNGGTTQFRNLVIADGKSASIATFVGSDHSVTLSATSTLAWGGGSAVASSSNVALLNATQAFTGRQTFSNTSGIVIGTLQGAFGNTIITDSGAMYLGIPGTTTQKLFITDSAGTGIFNITGAGALRLNAYGAGAATFDASGNITSVSDRRFKDRISELPYGLSEVLALQPVQHGYNALSDLDRDHLYGGFIAQDVQTVMPLAIGQDARGYLTLADRPILGAVVHAVQELHARLTALEQGH